MADAATAPNTSMQKRRAFLAVVQDDVTAATLSRMAMEYGWSEESVLKGGLGQALTVLAGIPTPKVLLLDLSDSADMMMDLQSFAEVCDPDSKVIVLGQINDINVYRTLVGMGVSDYLVKPLTSDVISQAIDAALAEPKTTEAKDEGQHDGKVVTVLGVRGGVGASTVAVNLAWLLANEQQMQTALVDLDLYFGTSSLALDLEPGNGFREALEAPTRIDDLFLERAGVNASEKLMILSAEEDLDRELRADGGACEVLFDRLRRTADFLVVDLPRGSRFTVDILRQSAEIILVADPTLSCLRDTLRFKALCEKLNPGMEPRVVLNREGMHGKRGISASEFAKESGLKTQSIMPFEPDVVFGALSEGLPIAETKGKSKALIALRDLAQVFAPRMGQETKTSFFASLFSSGKTQEDA